VKGYRLWNPKTRKLVITEVLLLMKLLCFMISYLLMLLLRSKLKQSMQVEHVVDLGSTPEIQQENVLGIHTDVEPPHRSIAVDRPKRDCRPTKRMIQEVNMAVYCLNVAEEIEGIVEPFRILRLLFLVIKING
jgi:hypothetical protein